MPSSPRRWEVIGLPRGYLSALHVGDERRQDSRYRRGQTLLRINRPMTPELVDEAFRWALATHEVTA